MSTFAFSPCLGIDNLSQVSLSKWQYFRLVNRIKEKGTFSNTRVSVYVKILISHHFNIELIRIYVIH